MSNGETFEFHEFHIPVPLLNMTGAGVETFVSLSNEHIATLQRLIGIEAHHNVLEIGCGIGRDAIPLTKILSEKGAYTGIDIIKPSIDFCTSNITPAYPNFRFFHLNVRDKLHNPDGRSRMTDFDLPAADNSIDRIFGWSVFTHMWEGDIRHYLHEFKRIMKPGAKAFLTCFIITPEVLERARATNLTQYDLTFEYQLDDRSFINVLEYPLGAIGYTPAAVRSMVEDSGLKLARDFVRGAWSGYYSDAEDGQDGILLVKENEEGSIKPGGAEPL